MILQVTLSLLCALIHLTSVSGHSWVTCTDYMEENGEYWNSDNCRAFPRHASQYAPRDGEFGRDTGYDVVSPPDGAPCKTTRNDNEAYDDQHPMAVYFPGQNVVITHPAKNHVADTRCTNKYIPDNGNRIWIGPRDATSDVTLTEFRSNLVADLGVSLFGHNFPDDVINTYPKPGFQNSPKFCEDTDKALATNAFVVPDLQPGRYTMLWGWSFNSEDDLYTTCWEVDIVGSRTERDQILIIRGQSSADPVNIASGGTTATSVPAASSTLPPSPSPSPSPSPNPNANSSPDSNLTPPPSTHVSTQYTTIKSQDSSPVISSGSSHVIMTVSRVLTSFLVYACATYVQAE